MPVQIEPDRVRPIVPVQQNVDAGPARLLDARRDGEGRYLILELVRGPGLADVLQELCGSRPAGNLLPGSGEQLARAAGLGEDTHEYRALAGLRWDRAVATFGASLAPVAWTVRAALSKQVTSIDGLCFSPETASQFDVVTGRVVRAGDDLGLRISTTTPRTVYVLSVFGGEDSAARLVSPMRPSPLVGGVPESTTRGGVFLPVAGTSDEHAAEQLAHERLRYAALSAAKAAGVDDWDFGEDLIRFEVLSDVAPE